MQNDTNSVKYVVPVPDFLLELFIYQWISELLAQEASLGSTPNV